MFAGAGLVHVDGVDFTLLSPRSLAVALFVAIPAAFGALLEPLHEWAHRRTQGLPDRVLLVLAVIALGTPIVIGHDLLGVALVVLGGIAVLLGQGERIGWALQSRTVAWAGRAAMAVVGALTARAPGALGRLAAHLPRARRTSASAASAAG